MLGGDAELGGIVDDVEGDTNALRLGLADTFHGMWRMMVSFASSGRGSAWELFSTGCASLHPWLQPDAPLGRWGVEALRR